MIYNVDKDYKGMAMKLNQRLLASQKLIADNTSRRIQDIKIMYKKFPHMKKDLENTDWYIFDDRLFEWESLDGSEEIWIMRDNPFGLLTKGSKTFFIRPSPDKGQADNTANKFIELPSTKVQYFVKHGQPLDLDLTNKMDVFPDRVKANLVQRLTASDPVQQAAKQTVVTVIQDELAPFAKRNPNADVQVIKRGSKVEITVTLTERRTSRNQMIMSNRTFILDAEYQMQKLKTKFDKMLQLVKVEMPKKSEDGDEYSEYETAIAVIGYFSIKRS